jgi:hypothetical protein
MFAISVFIDSAETFAPIFGRLESNHSGQITRPCKYAGAAGMPITGDLPRRPGSGIMNQTEESWNGGFP